MRAHAMFQGVHSQFIGEVTLIKREKDEIVKLWVSGPMQNSFNLLNVP